MEDLLTIRPTRSWKDRKNHFLCALEDPWYKHIAAIENIIHHATCEFYRKEGIKTLFLPITTGSISSPMGLGSDSLPVKVNLCGVETYLADSMQFMLEYGCRIFEKGCYYIMPSFRGEMADERHLCQFYHSEAEFPGGLSDVMNLVERYIQYLCESILAEYEEELHLLVDDLGHIEKMISLCGTIPKVTFDEAAVILKNDPKYIEFCQPGFRNITREGEKELLRETGGIVWITHFDSLAVPFYQACDESGQKALNADLLFGIGEVVGSGERHQNKAEVMKALNRHRVPEKEYEWYVEMKEKFPLKTAGFGLGIERFLLWLLKHDDIRDCQILPRFNGANIIP
ncbi:MAG: asparaginase [Clostridia bacterium]|nr:asparaginase [Clostridia bacterium]